MIPLSVERVRRVSGLPGLQKKRRHVPLCLQTGSDTFGCRRDVVDAQKQHDAQQNLPLHHRNMNLRGQKAKTH